MTKQELQDYYKENKRQGMSESQIARRLGMSLAHMMGILNGVDVDKIDPPKPKKEVKKLKEAVAKKLDIPEKSVEKEKPKQEDLSWMDD